MKTMEKISRKLGFMKRYVDFLKSHRAISAEELEENYELRSAIERNLELALESMLDIGEIIISEKGFEKPEDYKSVMLILGKEGVLPKVFAEKLVPAVGVRNILVHMYTEVDVEKICEFLRGNLGDFNEFAKHIANYLKKSR